MCVDVMRLVTPWCWVPPLCQLLQICSVGECCKIAAKMCHSQSAPAPAPPRPAVMSRVIFMTCHECVTTAVITQTGGNNQTYDE